MLNLDGLPLSIVGYRRAICLDINNPHVTVLEYYETPIRSTDGSIKIPAVMIYSKYISVKRQKMPSKKAIRIRDENRCVYCSQELENDNFTIDHVIPLSRFKDRTKANTWENKVSCCKRCNSKKADKTPEEANMKMARKPKRLELMFIIDSIPHEWKNYVSRR